MKKIVFLIIAIFSSLFANDEYQEFLKSYKKEFQTYKEDINKEFEAYKKAYLEGLEEYKKEISKKWPDQEVSTNHKFVQYTKDYNTKKSVDFQNSNVNVEVIAKDENEAREKIKMALNELANESVKEAYEKDQLENKINKTLNKKVEVRSTMKVIADALTPKEKVNFVQSATSNELKKKTHNNQTIFSLNVKLPHDTTVKKAQSFKEYIDKYASKRDIDKELVYAIMYSESSFNPMARSHIPAYGLMQIVPSSAGVDAYNFLHNEKKVLSSDYLYDSDNNIELGVAYLHILYYKYLKSIKDPLSRLYCAIAAYNTGAGNVAKAFIGSTNIAKASVKINSMSSEEVYKHLLRNLPYSETKKYLKKVNDQRFVYLKLLENNTL